MFNQWNIWTLLQTSMLFCCVLAPGSLKKSGCNRRKPACSGWETGSCRLLQSCFWNICVWLFFLSQNESPGDNLWWDDDQFTQKVFHESSRVTIRISHLIKHFLYSPILQQSRLKGNYNIILNNPNSTDTRVRSYSEVWQHCQSTPGLQLKLARKLAVNLSWCPRRDD